MKEKQIQLLSELKAIELDCVAKHADLLENDRQFIKVINIARGIMRSLEKEIS